MALSVRTDIPIPEVDALIHRLRDLGAKDTQNIKDKVKQAIISYGRKQVRNIFHNMLLDLYNTDIQLLKVDISKQMILKGTIELTDQEKQHCMRFIWSHLPEYLAEDDSFIKDLLGYGGDADGTQS